MLMTKDRESRTQRPSVRRAALVPGAAFVLMLALAPAVGDQHEKVGLYLNQPKTNQHFPRGPVMATIVWKKGMPMPSDTKTITVQVRRTGGGSLNYRRTIGYTTAVTVDLWPFAGAKAGKYCVRARSNSSFLGQWTNCRPFTTGAYRRLHLKKRYPKPRITTPPVEKLRPRIRTR